MKCAVIISFSFSASFVYGEVKGRLLYREFTLFTYYVFIYGFTKSISLEVVPLNKSLFKAYS